MNEIETLKEIFKGVKNGINPLTFNQQIQELNLNQLTLLLKFVNEYQSGYNFYRELIIDRLYQGFNDYAINYDLEEE